MGSIVDLTVSYLHNLHLTSRVNALARVQRFLPLLRQYHKNTTSLEAKSTSMLLLSTVEDNDPKTKGDVDKVANLLTHLTTVNNAVMASDHRVLGYVGDDWGRRSIYKVDGMKVLISSVLSSEEVEARSFSEKDFLPWPTVNAGAATPTASSLVAPFASEASSATVSVTADGAGIAGISSSAKVSSATGIGGGSEAISRRGSTILKAFTSSLRRTQSSQSNTNVAVSQHGESERVPSDNNGAVPPSKGNKQSSNSGSLLDGFDDDLLIPLPQSTIMEEGSVASSDLELAFSSALLQPMALSSAVSSTTGKGAANLLFDEDDLLSGSSVKEEQESEIRLNSTKGSAPTVSLQEPKAAPPSWDWPEPNTAIVSDSNDSLANFEVPAAVQPSAKSAVPTTSLASFDIAQGSAALVASTRTTGGGGGGSGPILAPPPASNSGARNNPKIRRASTGVLPSSSTKPPSDPFADHVLAPLPAAGSSGNASAWEFPPVPSTSLNSTATTVPFVPSDPFATSIPTSTIAAVATTTAADSFSHKNTNLDAAFGFVPSSSTANGSLKSDVGSWDFPGASSTVPSTSFTATSSFVPTDPFAPSNANPPSFAPRVAAKGYYPLNTPTQFPGMNSVPFAPTVPSFAYPVSAPTSNAYPTAAAPGQSTAEPNPNPTKSGGPPPVNPFDSFF